MNRSRSVRIRVTAAALCTAVALLTLASATALAAAPEAPVTEAASEVRAEGASFHGMLNPGKPGEGGTYEFIYRASKTECQGAGAIPEPPGMSFGVEHEAVSQEVSGLLPGTEYTVCLVATNLAAERAVGTPVTFKTAIPPETPAGEQATEVTSTTATLKGLLNPNKEGDPGTYSFFYNGAGTECAGAQSAPEPAASSTGHEAEAVEVSLNGLRPATTYTYCLVARNGAGERTQGPELTFTTATAAPTIGGETAAPIGARTTTISAEISPNGLPTNYRAEFVSEAQFKSNEWAEATHLPSSDAELSAASGPIAVRENLTGLQPGETYHYRFTASNPLGVTSGVGAVFTTSAATGIAAPDRRVYELVSAPGSGEPYYPPTPVGTGFEASGFRTPLPFRAAADGHAVAYVAEPSASAGTGETGPGEGNQWLASRTPGGWQTEDITPSENVGAIYEAFSSDLATAFYEGNATPLVPQVAPGCAALYSRASASPTFRPLFTAGKIPEECGQPLFAGATSDESQIIFQSEAALTPDAQPTTKADVPPGHSEEHAPVPSIGHGCMFGCNLYSAAAGKLTLVNVIEGEPVPSATFGGYAPGTQELTNFSNAISSNGSRIFWTDTQATKNSKPNPDMEHVYVLEDGTNNVLVSGAGAAEYWAATSDGHYAFYTEAGALWRFDTHANARERLTSDNAGVEGVIGTNQTGEPGEYLYFVANGVLSNAPTTPGECSVTGGAGCNLYVLHHGETTFIAKLSSEDAELSSTTEGLNQKSSGWRANLGERLAEVTPDGRHLVFQSVEKLAGYGGGNGSPQPAVFVYSADDAHLACVSCSPTGASSTAEDGARYSKLPVSTVANTYMRRWISDNGARVFFDSRQPLVARDTNGTQDVYEWERPAQPGETSNTCTAEEASPVTGGCTYLLSGGTNGIASFLVDADATGANVFFEHLGPLGPVKAPVDHNQLYDYHVDGGFAQIAVGCSGTTCQAGVSAPAPAPPPASLTFAGTGNLPPVRVTTKPLTRREHLALALKACRKHKGKRKRRNCERQARNRYGPIKAKRTRVNAKTASGAPRVPS